MRPRKKIEQAEGLAKKAIFPKWDGAFTGYAAMLREILGEMFGTDARKASYDDEAQHFFWEETDIVPIEESGNYDLDGSRVSVSRRFAIDVKKALGQQLDDVATEREKWRKSCHRVTRALIMASRVDSTGTKP